MKIIAAICAVATIAYIVFSAVARPYGGTWLGYTLGGIALVLVLNLTWYGIRKRQFDNTNFTVQEWLSAHVYFGIGVIYISLLHSAFEFGANVHTATFIVLVLVCLLGLVGVFLYIKLPNMIAENSEGKTLEEMVLPLADLNLECRRICSALGDEENMLVRHSVERTQIGGGFWRQITGSQVNCPTDKALNELSRRGESLTGEQAEVNRRIVELLSEKVAQLNKIRRHITLHARMKFWLYLHVPLTFALLALLVAHIFSVFYFL